MMQTRIPSYTLIHQQPFSFPNENKASPPLKRTTLHAQTSLLSFLSSLPFFKSSGFPLSLFPFPFPSFPLTPLLSFILYKSSNLPPIFLPFLPLYPFLTSLPFSLSPFFLPFSVSLLYQSSVLPLSLLPLFLCIPFLPVFRSPSLPSSSLSLYPFFTSLPFSHSSYFLPLYLSSCFLPHSPTNSIFLFFLSSALSLLSLQIFPSPFLLPPLPIFPFPSIHPSSFTNLSFLHSPSLLLSTLSLPLLTLHYPSPSLSQPYQSPVLPFSHPSTFFPFSSLPLPPFNLLPPLSLQPSSPCLPFSLLFTFLPLSPSLPLRNSTQLTHLSPKRSFTTTSDTSSFISTTSAATTGTTGYATAGTKALATGTRIMADITLYGCCLIVLEGQVARQTARAIHRQRDSQQPSHRQQTAIDTDSENHRPQTAAAIDTDSETDSHSNNHG
ncbi:hypothetical protein C7M84_021533 [Penaeus vannamei]|uniref:Uncharacterized protein n=1 Tax=Penaeus vannamei TaxID=6689 RepID=A0A423S9B5_PENVA|nr:hypothetical protein C7M84_021533 [Penaeus vannamei]